MAPMIGATMNSQSWPNAVPPTNKAGPMERAGFTDTPVTLMPTKWITTSAQANRQTRHRGRSACASCPKDDNDEQECRHDFKYKCGAHGVFAQIARTPAVLAQTVCGYAVVCFARGVANGWCRKKRKVEKIGQLYRTDAKVSDECNLAIFKGEALAILNK